jgi:hypothetical protein
VLLLSWVVGAFAECGYVLRRRRFGYGKGPETSRLNKTVRWRVAPNAIAADKHYGPGLFTALDVIIVPQSNPKSETPGEFSGLQQGVHVLTKLRNYCP